MKILNVSDFISERMNIVPISNDELEISAKPKERLENIEDFKYWLAYYKYEFEVQETGWGDGDGQKIAVKDKKRPQYTIYFDFVGTRPTAYEFIYYIEKQGMTDRWFDTDSTREIDRIDINDYVDVKKRYKYVVERRKKDVAKAKRTYQKKMKEDGRYASRYELDEAEARLERVMKKYNSI